MPITRNPSPAPEVTSPNIDVESFKLQFQFQDEEEDSPVFTKKVYSKPLFHDRSLAIVQALWPMLVASANDYVNNQEINLSVAADIPNIADVVNLVNDLLRIMFDYSPYGINATVVLLGH